MLNYVTKRNNDEKILIHSGTKGMKWGVRNYQNEDGTLTEAGKKRYYNMMPESAKRGAIDAYNKSINDKINYLQSHKYKTVKGEDLKGSKPGDSSLSRNGREFEISPSISWVAGKTQVYTSEGFTDDYRNTYPIFNNSYEAAVFAKTLDELPKNNYARQMFDENPNIKRALMNTALSEAVLKRNAMPTSARKAKEEAEKREKERKKKEQYENRMKANIPASAWEARKRALGK